MCLPYVQPAPYSLLAEVLERCSDSGLITAHLSQQLSHGAVSGITISPRIGSSDITPHRNQDNFR